MQQSTLENIFRYIILGCLYLVVWAPILMSAQFFFPAIVPKAVYMFFLIEIALVAFIPLCILSKNYRPYAHIIYSTLIIFGVVVFITSLTGINFHYSFWGNYERMDGIYTWLHLWILIVIAASVLRTKAGWRSFFAWALIPATLIAGYGFLQRAGVSSFGPWTIYETGQGRITGTIGNPAFFAVYLLFNITFGLTVLIDTLAPYWMRWYSGSMITVLFIAYIMTGVRGAFVGFVVGVIGFVLGYLVWMKKSAYKKYIIGLGIGFIIILGLLGVTRHSSEWVQSNFGRFFTISIADETTQTRLISWKGGVKGFTESPVFGVGPQKFDLVFNKYFDPSFYTLVGSETWWDRAHNMVIEVLTTMGIVGLIAYLGVGISILYALLLLGRMDDSYKPEALVLIAFLCAYFIQNLFVFDTISSYLVLAVFVAYVIAQTHMVICTSVIDRYSQKILKHMHFLNKEIAHQYWILGLVGSTLIIGPTAFAHNITVTKHNKKFLDILAHTQRKPVNTTLHNFREVLELSDFDRKEVTIKLAQFMTQYALQNKVSVQELHNGFGFVRTEMKKAIQANQKDVRLLISYGNALNVYAELLHQQNTAQAADIAQEAEDILLEAVELGPSRQQVFYSLANTYMIRGENDKGVSVLEDAVKIHDETAQAYWVLALGNVRAGHTSAVVPAALAAVERGYTFTSVAEANSVANAFVTEGNVEGLRTIYERMIVSVPTGQAYAKLAALHAQLGNKEKALELADEVVRRDASLRDQVADFVEKVRSGENIDFLN